MKFSVIVPVYNVEKYLKKCIDSILAQDYSEIEILLIDDGSNDSSGMICDQYAETYTNVFVYHKENGGLSDARNYGLHRISGDYVVFVDGDDWIEEGCFTEFAKVLSKTHFDVLATRLIEAFENENVYRDSQMDDYLKKTFTKDRALDWIIKYSENTWPAPKNIYAASYIQKNNLRFLKGRLHEDMDWTSNVCYTAETFVASSFPWYYHRMQRFGSITNSIKAKNIIDVIEMAAIHYHEYKKEPSPIRKKVVNRLMESVYAKLNQVKCCTRDDKNKVIKCVADNMEIFEIAPSFKYKIFVFALRLVGPQMAIELLGRL